MSAEVVKVLREVEQCKPEEYLAVYGAVDRERVANARYLLCTAVDFRSGVCWTGRAESSPLLVGERAFQHHTLRREGLRRINACMTCGTLHASQFTPLMAESMLAVSRRLGHANRFRRR